MVSNFCTALCIIAERRLLQKGSIPSYDTICEEYLTGKWITDWTTVNMIILNSELVSYTIHFSSFLLFSRPMVVFMKLIF